MSSPTFPRTVRGRLVLPALAVALATGCGMSADTTVRAQAEKGVADGQVLKVVETEYVCPHQIPIANKRFSTQEVKAGEVTGAFGPMVPCNAVVGQGGGMCPSCRNPYHTPGSQPVAVCTNVRFAGPPRNDGRPLEEAEVTVCGELLGPYREGGMQCRACEDMARQWQSAAREMPAPPWTKNTTAKPSAEATVQFRCPYEDCQKVVDPVALQLKETSPREPSRFQPGHCPHCKRYFETQASDVLETLAHPLQLICPSCSEPVDPTMNACTNPSCGLGGVIHMVTDFEGPCWRCGGVKVCPDCGGSGLSPQGTYGGSDVATLPTGCWQCETVVDAAGGVVESTGRCPECDWLGFATYEGALPADYSARRNVGGAWQAQPSSQRGWELQDEQAPPGAP